MMASSSSSSSHPSKDSHDNKLDEVLLRLNGLEESVETIKRKVQSLSEKIMEGNASSSSESKSANIILNHDFSRGLESWHPNWCHGYVVSAKSGSQGRMLMESDFNYAVITDRKECWQGLEQDITGKIFIGSTYKVSAVVGASKLPQACTDVKATLRLQYRVSAPYFFETATKYLCIGRASVREASWARLEGTFSLSPLPERVIFYLEGPAPGVDLLIKSVEITCSSPNEYHATSWVQTPDQREQYIKMIEPFSDILRDMKFVTKYSG